MIPVDSGRRGALARRRALVGRLVCRATTRDRSCAAAADRSPERASAATFQAQSRYPCPSPAGRTSLRRARFGLPLLGPETASALCGGVMPKAGDTCSRLGKDARHRRAWTAPVLARRRSCSTRLFVVRAKVASRSLFDACPEYEGGTGSASANKKRTRNEEFTSHFGKSGAHAVIYRG